MSKLLKLENVSRNFGGLVAVNDLSFELDNGQIMGIIGPNGAGKTTVFNLITGNYTVSHGNIYLHNKSIINKKANEIVKLGIARTFQSIRLFPNLTALDNVLAGRHCRMKTGMLGSMFPNPKQIYEEKAAIKRCYEELYFVGLEDYALQKASSLSYGNQRLLEMARALASDPELLILDEPAGSMNQPETEVLVRLIKNIRERGTTVILIEHDMKLVMQVCEKLLVLEYGIKIAEGKPQEVRNNPRVIEAYLGVDESD